MPRTALIVAVPEAEPAVHELRLRHDWSARHGVPAHVTVLFPFLTAGSVDDGALRTLFARHDAFEFVLDRVEQFQEGAVWLHPEPSAPFRALTAAVWRRWPECPPYEGAHDDVIPHLTISDEPVDVIVELPIAARADEVTLIEEQSDGRWLTRQCFALRAGT
jgi:hypothetical protein